MDASRETLEYIGPPGVAFDDETEIKLIAGRRYQMSAALAAYRLEHDTGHWKRPDSPKAATAKE